MSTTSPNASGTTVCSEPPMAPIHVGISGINAVDNPGPGAGVARSLKEDAELEVEVLGLAYDAMEPGIYMDWLFGKSFIMPYPSGGGEALLERLLYIKKNHGLDCVIPCLDSELPVYIRYERELRAAGIETFLPTREQFRLRSKENLAGVAETIGVRCPRTEVLTSPAALAPALERLGLPVMVKGPLYKAFRAVTAADAAAYFHQLVAEWGYPVLLQEVVAGEEMNVVGVGDGEGGDLGTVGIKKSWVTSLGKIWTGLTVRHEAMLAAARALTHELEWRGPFELECIVADGEVHLIEINPRFPAWSYFATAVGQNLPANLIRKMLGKPLLEAPPYEAGRLYVRYTYELVTDLECFQKIVTRGES